MVKPLFKEFKNTIKANPQSFKTVSDLNDIIFEIKSNLSELSEKQEIKLNKLESKLDRLENKVVINKLNATSLIHKNEILNAVADLDTSVIKPFINTINKINETDLPEILEAVQSIPTTDLKPALDEIKTDVKGFLAALESVPTVDDITSAVDELTDRIIGNDYFAQPGRKLLPELVTDVQSDTNSGFETTNNKLDEITGAIESLDCIAPPSDLELAIDAYEEELALYFIKSAETGVGSDDLQKVNDLYQDVLAFEPIQGCMDLGTCGYDYVKAVLPISLADFALNDI